MSFQRPAHWPYHWRWFDLTDVGGDTSLRLLEAVNAAMDVCAIPPACAEYRPDLPEVPVLAMDPDFWDLPRDHTQGTPDDEITQVAVVKLVMTILAVADRYK